MNRNNPHENPHERGPDNPIIADTPAEHLNERVVDDELNFDIDVANLEELQTRIEYGGNLINRLGDPAFLSEFDKETYETYTKLKRDLEEDKQKVIEGMMNKIKQNPKYKNLSIDTFNAIKEYIEVNSCWKGFVFNIDEIEKIINRINGNTN